MRRPPLWHCALAAACVGCGELAVGRRVDAASPADAPDVADVADHPDASEVVDAAPLPTHWIDPMGPQRARERLLLVDFDLDGLDDLCARFGDAYGCARNTGTSRFEGWTEVPGMLAQPTAFTVARATAVAFDEDGYPDLCTLDARGVVCRFGDGRGRFVSTRAGIPFVSPITFGERAAELSMPAYSEGFALVRLRARNRPEARDACARFTEGIRCALIDGLGAFSTTRTAGSAFADGVGAWRDPARAQTLRGGDVDGDGRDDVCMRGPDGVHCAHYTEPTSAFSDSERWSPRFTDAEGWDEERYRRSFVLADVNGDGRADWCGRGPRGVRCELSSREGRFEGTEAPVIEAWGDAAGWTREPSDARLMVVDLDHDRRVDLCAALPEANTVAVWCARSLSSATARFEAPELVGRLPDAAGAVAVGVVHRGGVTGFCAATARGGVACTERPR